MMIPLSYYFMMFYFRKSRQNNMGKGEKTVNTNMLKFKFCFRWSVCIVFFLSLTGCPSLSVQRMVPSEPNTFSYTTNQSIRKIIVTGVENDSPGLGSQLCMCEHIHNAVTKTLTNTELFDSIDQGQGDIDLLVNVRSQHTRYVSGLELRWEIIITYRFVGPSEETIWTKTYESGFSGNNAGGKARYVYSCEGVVRENIKAFLRGLSVLDEDFFASKIATIINANDTNEKINLDYSIDKPQGMTGLDKQESESIRPNDTINLTTNPKGTQIDRHDKYKIAFLPWDTGSGTQTKNLIIKVADYIKKSDDLEIIASCYDLSLIDPRDVEKIGSIERSKIWKKHSIFEVKKPDIEQVCKIGEKLDADVIMVVSFSTESNSYNLFKYLRIYLIDVTSGKQCVFNNRERLNDFNFNQRIFEILENVFNDYRDLRRDVAYKMN